MLPIHAFLIWKKLLKQKLYFGQFAANLLYSLQDSFRLYR